MRDEEEDSAVETSFEEFAKRAEQNAEDDDDSVLDLTADDDRTAAESISVKVLPPQQNEFTCRSCFLVKHRSQLADRKKLTCRDCA